MNKDRMLGACLGGSCGDALGVSQEFAHPKDRKPFPELNLGPQTDIVGGGAFHLEPGAISDDTHMATAIAGSLLAQGHFDPKDVLKRYARWRTVTFDIGGTTSGGISASQRLGPVLGGHEVWKTRGDNCAANGSLMRTYPLGVWFHADPKECLVASMQESGITHGHPLCLVACAAFNAAIAAAVHHDELPIEGMLEASRTTLDELHDDPMPYLTRAFNKHIADELRKPVSVATRTLRLDLDAAVSEKDPLTTRHLDMYGTQGYVRVAWTLAWWELFHAPDFRSGILDISNRAGDSDTNGAIAGALLGAYYGAAAIPESWKTKVLNALQNGPPSPLRDEFHPKVFLPFVEALKAPQ